MLLAGFSPIQGRGLCGNSGCRQIERGLGAAALATRISWAREVVHLRDA